MNPDDMRELLAKWQQAERNYVYDQYDKKMAADRMWQELDKQITLPKTPYIKPITPKVTAKPVPKRPFPPQIQAFSNYSSLEAFVFWNPLFDSDNESTRVIAKESLVFPLYIMDWKGAESNIYTVFRGAAQKTQQPFPVLMKYCYSGAPDYVGYIIIKFQTPIYDGTNTSIGFLIDDMTFKIS